MEDLIIKTTSGLIEGMYNKDETVRLFKGVPYAASPVGNLRFARPQKKQPWRGIRPTKSYGPKAYQADQTKGELYPKEFYSGQLPPMSEDCLYLNIFAPKIIAKPLPVLMWIHGGAFMHGYGSEIEFDGENMAKKDIIMVSINYRTGALAFFAHDDLDKEIGSPSGNLGIHDQIFALEWIRENIAAFGGDPEKITVAGQSAGCMSAQIMTCSKLTTGKINRAIFQSGAGIPGFSGESTETKIKAASLSLMELLGCTTIEQMRALSPEDICYGGYELMGKLGGLVWAPYVDGYLLDDICANLIQRHEIHHIPYMIGSTKDEMGADTAKLLASSAIEFAKIVDGHMFVYQFAHDLPSSNDGAFHSSELWYEFETLDSCWREMGEEDYALAKQMSNEFANFIKGEKPAKDWVEYSAANPFIRYYR